MKNKVDVLLVARPDHSMQIYRSLLKQNDLSFKYITFKVVPQLVKRIFRYKKLQTVTRFCKIAIKPTIIQVCKKTFNFKFARNWVTDDFLSPYVNKALKKSNYRLIHYWPEYASSAINKHLQNSNNTIIIADMYMPNPLTIIEDMLPIYAKYGINDDANSWLRTYASQMDTQFKYVTDVVVPSKYVADSMKQTFPNKNYHIVPYGITISPKYEMKNNVSVINKFVYVGRISVEKGCDILLNWFKKHKECEIHLYGGMWDNQKSVFEEYKAYSNIIFHGTVSKQTLIDEIPNYHVGIHMSRFDAYSLAVGEIIGCGLPVIVSNKTGNFFDVYEHNWGLVSELTEASLDESIKQMQDVNNYNKFIDSIDKYIRESSYSYGEQILQLYHKLLNK